MVDVSKAKELITSEDQGLQTTLERSSETLSSLAQVISEANATLLNAQDAQHRRHELALRRRTLLGEDVDGIAASTCSVSGDGEEGIGERRTAAEEEQVRRKREVSEQSVADLSRQLLEAQQQVTKKKQNLASWDSQVAELQVHKQMAVDKRAFRDASSINSQIKALTATREVEAQELQGAVDLLAALNEELTEARLQADSLALQVRDSNERIEENRVRNSEHSACSMNIVDEMCFHSNHALACSCSCSCRRSVRSSYSWKKRSRATTMSLQHCCRWRWNGSMSAAKGCGNACGRALRTRTTHTIRLLSLRNPWQLPLLKADKDTEALPRHWTRQTQEQQKMARKQVPLSE